MDADGGTGKAHPSNVEKVVEEDRNGDGVQMAAVAVYPSGEVSPFHLIAGPSKGLSTVHEDVAHWREALPVYM